MKLFFKTAMLLTILIGCNEQKENHKSNKSSFDLEAVKNYIHEANKVYGDRFKHDDLTWYENKYCKDACALPPNQPSVCGIEAIQRLYYDSGKNKEFIVEIIAKNIYGGENAVVEEGIYSYPDGTGGSYDTGKFIAIWKQENNTWKLYREIWNSDMTIKN